MKKGFSLALTLWIVAIISLASALYIEYGKDIIKKSYLLNEKLLVTFKAESIVELIKFYGSTGNIRFNFVENRTLKNIFPNFPTKVFLDSRSIIWDNTTIILQDSAGLIDMNDIDAISSYISGSFSNFSEKSSIIKDSINDWLDMDEFTRLNGAENAFYKKFGYKARNRNYFATIDELFLLRGVKDLNNTQKEKLKSFLVISEQETRNLLTLKSELLKRIYHLSDIDILRLQDIKNRDINAFMALFMTMDKENYNFEVDGIFPSNVIKVKIISSRKDVKKEIEFLIDFTQSENKIYEVLDYKD